MIAPRARIARASTTIVNASGAGLQPPSAGISGGAGDSALGELGSLRVCDLGDETHFRFWVGRDPHSFRKAMHGTNVTTSWSRFCSAMSRPSVAAHTIAHEIAGHSAMTCDLCKAQQGCLTPAVFRGALKQKSEFLGATGWHLDVDWNGDTERLRHLLSGRCRCVIHSTFKSNDRQRRARVVGPFDRVVSWETAQLATQFIVREWVGAALKSDIVRAASAAGTVIDDDATIPNRQLVVDDAAIRIGQVAYLPMIPEGGEQNFHFERVDGPLVDVEACAARQREYDGFAGITATKPSPQTSTTVKGTTTSGEDGMTDWRAPVSESRRRHYLDRALGDAATKVRSAPKHTGHNTLRDEAQSLARYAELSIEDILGALAPAYLARGGHSAEECQQTVRSAVTWRRQTPRK